jgi:hypothetical protein
MNLESDKRPNIQLRLDFPSAPTGEARQAGREDIESLSVVSEPERPANTNRIMEEVCERANLKEALRQVRGNKGSAGVDRMTVDQLGDYLKQHWPAIREQLLNGTYEPKPVRRVEIPKPDGGGMRKLGIPTVLDRFIQQAVMQVLQKRWNPTFSHHSYGFRPYRSAHQAVAQAQQYIVQGYGWVIDLDLEKFFDRVNHDKLMGQIAKRVVDKRLLKLIRAFLNAGVMENGLVSPSVEAYRTSMREDGEELRLVRRACSRLHLRPHGLGSGTGGLARPSPPACGDSLIDSMRMRFSVHTGMGFLRDRSEFRDLEAEPIVRLWVHLKYLDQHTAIAALAHGTRNCPAYTTKFSCLLG